MFAACGHSGDAADGMPLTVRRFDDHWITAVRGDVSYEFNRDNGNLAYASSTTKDGIATIIIRSGQCEVVAVNEGAYDGLPQSEGQPNALARLYQPIITSGSCACTLVAAAGSAGSWSTVAT